MGQPQLVRWEIKPMQRTRRGLDERIALAAPELNRRLNVLLMGLRLGSRLRRVLLSRAVRVGFAANNRRDYESLQLSFDPEIEIQPPLRGSAVSGVGLQPLYRGHEGLRQFLEDWKSGFDQFRYEPREIADAGGGRFAVRVDFVASVAGSATELRDEAWTVYIASRGLVVRNPTFYEWAEAIAALAGPDEAIARSRPTGPAKTRI